MEYYQNWEKKKLKSKINLYNIIKLRSIVANGYSWLYVLS